MELWSRLTNTFASKLTTCRRPKFLAYLKYIDHEYLLADMTNLNLQNDQIQLSLYSWYVW